MEDTDTWKDRLKNLVADDWITRLMEISTYVLIVLIILFIVVIAINFKGPTISNVFNNIDDCPSAYPLCEPTPEPLQENNLWDYYRSIIR